MNKYTSMSYGVGTVLFVAGWLAGVLFATWYLQKYQVKPVTPVSEYVEPRLNTIDGVVQK